MELVIRSIEAKDYHMVTDLLVHHLFVMGVGGENVVPFFDKVKDDDNYLNFVALLDDEVVGFLSAVTFYSAGAAGRFLYLQQIVVRTEHRNKGIGTEIMRYIEDYAKANGMNGIGLCSGHHRTDAHRFYERNGFSKLTQWLGKHLTP